MIKKIILLSIVINGGTAFGFGLRSNPQYNNAALNSAYQAIQQKAINVSTSEVANRAGTETDVAQSFEEEFLTDPTEDAPISEKRKVQRSMGLIRAVCKAQNVSGLTLEASDFYETVALDLHNKEKSLEDEKAGLFSKKVMLASFVVVGGIAMVGGAMVRQNDKRAGKLIGGIGAAVTVGGVAGLGFTMGQEDRLNKCIAQTQTMKNGWENSFKAK